MTTPALLMLLSSLSVSIHLVSVAKLSRAKVPSETVLFLTHLGAFIFLISLLPVLEVAPKINLSTLSIVWLPLLLAFACQLASKMWQYSSYSDLDVAQVAGLSALTPLISVVLGLLVLGERPAPTALFGLVLVVVSAYFLSFWNGQYKLTNPIKRILQHGATRVAFFSAVVPAVAIILTKKTLNTLDPYFFSFLILLLMSLASGVLSLRRKSQDWSFSKKNSLGIHLMIASITLALSYYLTAMATQKSQASYISAMSILSIVFQIILGMAILRQRDHFIFRLSFSLLILLGFWMLGKA